MTDNNLSKWEYSRRAVRAMMRLELADYIREAISELEDTQELLREARGVLLAEQETSSPWQPIETAPKDGTWLIGRCKGDGPDFTTLIRRETPNEHWRGLDSIGIRYVSPTHWMPLPNPPSP